jgi:DHA2 family multidrug resistance protein
MSAMSASASSAAAAPAKVPADDTWRPSANPWAIALTVTLVAFMEVLDTTIVNVALPHIAGSLSASNDDATWALTSYLVANGIVLPMSGFFSRLLGRKRYFLICIGMFTVCSLLCGVATSLPMLIVSRLAQGFFGGGLQPNQQAIILDTFEPSRRGTAFSVTALATIVAPIVGPTLGGWITDNYSWRWVFFINVPVGLFAFFAVSALVEDPPWIKRGVGKVAADWVGLSLITIGFGCLQVFMDRGEDDDWFGSSFITAMFIIAAVGLTTAVVWLSYAKNPVVNLRVLRDRNFAAGCISVFSLGFMLYSSAVVIPQFAQSVLGYTATLAGLILSPGAVVIVVFIPIVSRLLPLVQTRYLVMTGFFTLGCALLYSHRLTPTTDFETLAFIRAAQTVGIAFLFVPISSIAYSTLPKRLSGDATSLFTMFRNVAGSIGISAATAIVEQRRQVHLAYLSRHLSPFSAPYQQLLHAIGGELRTLGYAATAVPRLALGLVNVDLTNEASLLAYMDVFEFSAVVAFCVVPFCFLFRPTKAGGAPPPMH